MIRALEQHVSESSITTRDHVRSLRQRLASNTVCPRCGSDLVERTVKRGTIPDEDLRKIKIIIIIEKPEKYGFMADRWTGPVVRKLISDKYGVSYQEAQIYNLLRKMGMRFEKKKGLVEAN